MASVEIIPATAAQARELTDRIKVAVDGTWLLIQQAYTARAWAALGYSSWDDYCTREFGTSRLRLPREERQEVVASLREIGMSVRAIAAATGDSRETIRREIAGDTNESPASIQGEAMSADSRLVVGTDEVHPEHFGAPSAPTPSRPPITGTDGKTYSQPNQRPQQRPRTDVVATVNRALLRAQEAARAADEITRQHLAGRKEEAATWHRSLSRSLESLQRLHHLLEED